MNNNNVLSFYTEFDDIRRYSAYKDFRDYFILKKQSRWRFLYKYLKVESFKECLKNGNIMFQEPYGWKDKFESRFYLADYRNVTSDTSTTPKMYATCFTRTKECEASWHVYNRSDKEKCGQKMIDVEPGVVPFLSFDIDEMIEDNNPVIIEKYEQQIPL